jgi:hypothetical protein
MALLWLAVGLLCWSPARADSFRCGRKVVRSGDTLEELLQRCGEPRQRGSGYESIWLPDGQQRVRVERWHYKLGGRKLERVVLLYRGQIVAVRTGPR